MKTMTVTVCTQDIDDLHSIENDVSLTADIDSSHTGDIYNSCTGDLDRHLESRITAVVTVNHNNAQPNEEKLSVAQLEHENNDLHSEILKLKRAIETLNTTIQRRSLSY